MFRFLTILGVFAFLPVQAMAVEINDQGAQSLKKMVQGLLDYQKKTGEAFDSVVVEYDGEVVVEQMADYYAVTFPRILLKAPNELAQVNKEIYGGVVDVGVISMSAVPDAKAGDWKTVIQFPESLTLIEGDKNAAVFKVNLGKQNTIGILNENLGYFTKLNMNVSDITFDANGEDVGFKLGGVQIYQNFNEVSDGYYSGPFKVSLGNVEIAPPEEAESVRFEEFKFEGDMDQIKLPRLVEYQEKVVRFAEAMSSVTNGGEETPESQKEMINALTDFYDFDWNGFSAGYGLKNLSVKSLGNDDEVRLGDASFGMAFSGLKSDAGVLDLTGDYNGLSIQSSDMEDIQDVIPTKAKIDIKLENLPYTSLSEMGKNSMSSIAANPEMAQMVGLGLMMKLPALLTQSGVKATISENGLSNSVYDFSMNGEAVADLKAMMGFTAKLKTVFEGLDVLISVVEAKGEGAPRDLHEGLLKIKEIGTAESGPNGKPAYGYTFEVTPDGQTLINGQDAASVLK
ncbi:MAG: hypothetical protein ACRBDI_09250 [Alphaproteobacteria bacterium]